MTWCKLVVPKECIIYTKINIISSGIFSWEEGEGSWMVRGGSFPTTSSPLQMKTWLTNHKYVYPEYTMHADMYIMCVCEIGSIQLDE